MAPIIVRFKDSISYKNFRKIALVFLILASISRWTTSEIYLSWDLDQSFEYTGYFMTGYVIRKDMKKSNLNGSFLIMLGLLIEIATAFLMYRVQIINGIDGTRLKFKINSPYCPTVVIASLFIFTGFTMLKIKYNKRIEELAGMSFIIYLVHAGAWGFIQKTIYRIFGKNWIENFNNICWIPVFVFIVFVISVFLANIYNNLALRFQTNIRGIFSRKQ